MTETDEKHENPEEKKPVKQGLHGWKAALAMFGCGSLAAFGVFGVLFAVATMFLNSLSSGVSSEEADIAVPGQSGQPEEEVHPRSMDLCGGYFETVDYVNVNQQISGSFEDSQDEADDVSPNEDRTLSGACEYMISPALDGYSQWHFDIDFDVVIQDSGLGPDEKALQLYEEEVSDLASERFDREVHDWTPGDVPGEAASFYAADVDGISEYHVVAYARSAVYIVSLRDDPVQSGQEAVPEDAFEREAKDIVESVGERFRLQIPE